MTDRKGLGAAPPPSSTRVAQAFGAKYNVTGVRITYIGKDAQGRPVYRFTGTYKGRQAPSGFGSASSGNTTINRTMAVSSGAQGYVFSAPINTKAATSPITSPENATLRNVNQPLIDRAIIKINDLVERGLMSVAQANTLIKNLPNMSASSITALISRGGEHGQQPTVRETGVAGSATDNAGDIFSDFSGFSGGGGSGSIGPEYRAPDKRVVEDFVKGALVSRLGYVPEHLVGPNVELYMRDDRRNFDSPTAEIDPSQSVIVSIRNTREYQTIHSLRPASMDETAWVAERASQAAQGGLDTANIEAFAVTQATAGADVKDVAEAASVAQFQRSGQAPAMLDQKFRNVAQQIFGAVRR